MCGRFTSSQPREALAERFEIAPPADYRERFNLAPTQPGLIVRVDKAGLREAALARWGLLPHWAKDAKLAYKLINARAETLTARPAFRSLLPGYRCLVPADGFYEWRTDEHGKRVPVHFSLADGGAFAFAGLWTSRRDEATGGQLETFTIVTTTPNELVAAIHDRMPVILPQACEQLWLDPELSAEHALTLLEPFPASALQARPASQRVNAVQNDDPGLLEPDLDTLFAA